MKRSARWAEAIEMHRAAAASVACAAEAVPAELWHAPRPARKWSPAQLMDHLILGYEVLLRELAGGQGMVVRTSRWQRVVLRVTIWRRILAGGGFPKGGVAPREVRPESREPDQAEAIEWFRARAADFEAAIENARANGPRRKLTHAYFGSVGLEAALRFCALHLRHHEPQLAPSADTGAGSAASSEC